MSPDEIIFEALRQQGVQFTIVGGHAVIFHGFRRTTEDADVVWIRSPESEKGLEKALVSIGGCYIGKEIDPATGIEKLHPVSLPFIQAHHLMMLWTNHGFLDLFDYVPGHPELDVQQAWASSVEVQGLRYASLELLRKMKHAAGRTKDLYDLQKLAELYGDVADTDVE